MNDLGKTLSRFRKKSGITQRELAAELNVDPTTISQYERGHRTFPIELLEPTCDCLGISIWDFLKETFPERRPNQSSEQK